MWLFGYLRFGYLKCSGGISEYNFAKISAAFQITKSQITK